jgi:vacuolar-type H+-ATPase subunit I/STV1
MEEQMNIISELEETIEMVSRYSARVDNRTRKLERKVVDLTEELEKLQNLMERLVDRDNFRVNNILKKKYTKR